MDWNSETAIISNMWGNLEFYCDIFNRISGAMTVIAEKEKMASASPANRALLTKWNFNRHDAPGSGFF